MCSSFVLSVHVSLYRISISYSYIISSIFFLYLIPLSYSSVIAMIEFSASIFVHTQTQPYARTSIWWGQYFWVRTNTLYQQFASSILLPVSLPNALDCSLFCLGL